MTTKKTSVKKKPAKPVKSPKKVPTKKPSKKKSNNKQKTYVAIVLDKSGSMANVAKETVDSFNGQIETIKKESVGMDTKVMLTVFNQSTDHKFFNVSVDSFKTLTVADYAPDGWTAMYDGICQTIDKMEKELSDINDPNTAVLFTIITDGAENSSKLFGKSDVSGRIKRLKDTKRWTFNLVGANIDLEKASDDLNISKGNILKISSSRRGIVRGMTASTQMYGTYMTNRRSVNNTDDLAVLSEQAVYSATPDVILDMSDDAVDTSIKK